MRRVVSRRGTRISFAAISPAQAARRVIKVPVAQTQPVNIALAALAAALLPENFLVRLRVGVLVGEVRERSAHEV